MSATQFDIELLLLEIEELFERFRTLSQESRAVILAKLKIKLLEEFKDFIIQESDINQETVIEISYRSIVDDNASKDVNIIELPGELSEDIENYCESTTIDNPAHDFFPSIETIHVEPEKVIVHSTDRPQQNDVVIVTPTEPRLSQQNDVVIVTATEPHPSQHNDVFTKPKVIKEPKTKTCLICNYCGNQYEKKKLFKTHLRRHENNRKYECASCSLRFNVKDDLIKHLKTHSSEKKFKCSICSKLFVNNVWLKNHMKVIHEKNVKYFCQKCDYFSFSNHTLKEHVKLKHDKLFRKYACLICKNVFISKTELKIHLRTHTGEKPYQCNLCTAAFTRSGGLTNHMNNVHGEKKFPCEICEKSFKTADKLKRHFLIHTRIKPFSCPFCNNYASNTQGNLNKHVKVVHQMNDFSYSKYKKMMLGQVENVREEWIKNAESVTNEYLENLSNQNQTLTVEQLKEQYTLQKKKKTSTEKTADTLLIDKLHDKFKPSCLIKPLDSNITTFTMETSQFSQPNKNIPRYCTLNDIYQEYGIPPLEGTENIPYSEEDSSSFITDGKETDDEEQDSLFQSAFLGRHPAEELVDISTLLNIFKSMFSILNSKHIRYYSSCVFKHIKFVCTFMLMLIKFCIYFGLIYRSYKYFRNDGKSTSIFKK